MSKNYIYNFYNNHPLSKYYLLFVILGISTYGVAIFFPPYNPDDLIILSSIIKEGSPINFFWKDWGLNNSPLYRPFHSISIWISYLNYSIGHFAI